MLRLRCTRPDRGRWTIRAGRAEYRPSLRKPHWAKDYCSTPITAPSGQACFRSAGRNQLLYKFVQAPGARLLACTCAWQQFLLELAAAYSQSRNSLNSEHANTACRQACLSSRVMRESVAVGDRLGFLNSRPVLLGSPIRGRGESGSPVRPQSLRRPCKDAGPKRLGRASNLLPLPCSHNLDRCGPTEPATTSSLV